MSRLYDRDLRAARLARRVRRARERRGEAGCPIHGDGKPRVNAVPCQACAAAAAAPWTLRALARGDFAWACEREHEAADGNVPGIFVLARTERVAGRPTLTEVSLCPRHAALAARELGLAYPPPLVPAPPTPGPAGDPAVSRGPEGAD